MTTVYAVVGGEDRFLYGVWTEKDVAEQFARHLKDNHGEEGTVIETHMNTEWNVSGLVQ